MPSFIPSIQNATYEVRWVRVGILDEFGCQKVNYIPCKSYMDAMNQCVSLAVKQGIRGEILTAIENHIPIMSVNL